MVQRYVFPQATQISNMADPASTDLTGATTVNYLNNAIFNSAGIFLDTPAIWADAAVPSGTIILTTGIPAGTPTQMTVQTTGVAGTETAIKQFIDNYGTTESFRLVNFTNSLFTVLSTVANSGTVTLNLGLDPTFATAVPSGTILQFQTAPAAFTRFRDIVLGTNLTGTITNNVQARPTLTLNASGGGSGSVSVNSVQVSNPNFVNNPASLGTNLTVNGSNITAAVRTSDVVAVADSEIALKIGSVETIQTFPDISIPLIVSFPASNQMILDVDSQQEAQLLLNKYLWRNANGTNNGTTDTLFVTNVQQEGVTQFQARITVTGNFSASGWTTATPTIYYTTNAPAGKFTFQSPPQAEIIRLAQGAVRTANSSFNLGTVYSADNVGISTRVISTTPTVSNVSGVLNSVVDYGAISITSTPWPIPIPTGGNTAFLAIEASDFSWSGIGSIQTTPSNGLVQIAWVRPPAGALAGTSFTNARVWALVDAISTLFVGSSVADATNDRPPATTLVYPDLTLGSITSSADSYGGSSTSIALVPTINQQIATNIGQANSGTSGYVAGNVSSVTTGFGNTGTTWTARITDYTAAYAFLQTIGATPPAGNVPGSWTLPNWTLYISNLAAPTTSQFATVISIASNPTNTFLVITFSGNQPYFANVGPGAQPLFISNNRFTFVPAPQAEIIRLSNVNNVSSLNVLKGDVALTQGQGIGISTSGQNITITNTAAGVSSSNFTSFIVEGGILDGGVAFVSVDETGFGEANIGFGVQADDAGLDGGYIGTTKYIGTTQTIVSPYGFSMLFPVATTYTDLEVLVYVPNFSLNFVNATATVTNTFSLDDVLFSRADSNASAPPDKNSQIFPGFKINDPSDDIQLLAIVPSVATFTQTDASGVNFSVSVTGGLYSGVTNNYAHPSGATTVGYIGWHRIIGGNITSISNFVVNIGVRPGSIRALVALPGTGGATPTWAQTLAISNVSGPGVAAIFQDTTTPTPRSVSLQAPTTVSTSYQLRLPAAQASAAGQVLANDGSGNLSWAAASLPGGTNLSYQWNNSGAFAGDNAMFRDVNNNRVSVSAPVDSANVARLADVQAAAAGIKPADPQGATVNISESNIVGTYTNNTGVGTATLTGTTTSILQIAGRNVGITELVLLVAQTQGIQNGIYAVTAISTIAFTLTRRSTVITFGELWVSTAFGASNYGVQYFNTTTGTITVGTTPITYSIFGVANGAGITLQQVTNNGNLTSNPILLGASDDYLQLTTSQISRSAAGNLSLRAGNSSTDRVLIGGSGGAAVNSVTFSGWTTGTSPTIAVTGDANLSLNLATSGVGTINLGTNQTNYVQVRGATGGVPQITAAGSSNVNLNIAAAGTGTIAFGTNQTNYLRLTPGAAGSAVTLQALGETNVSLNISGIGTGVVNLGSNQPSYVRITPGASGVAPIIAAVGTIGTNLTLDLRGNGSFGINLANNAANYNYVNVTPSGTGNAPVIQSAGNDSNPGLRIQAKGTGSIQIGDNAQAILLGSFTTATWNNPLFAAPSLDPVGSGLTDGIRGQALVSRGPGRTPAWAPITTSLRVQAYSLSHDQTVVGTNFTFNVNAIYTNGASFGAFGTDTATFSFTDTGYYFVSFTYNCLNGTLDLSIIINDIRVAGSTGGGVVKATMAGGGAVTAAAQTLVVRNYVTANVSAGQSFLVIIKIV